jgi:hypothetical protein
MIITDCIGSCKFNYHTITTKTAPQENEYIYLMDSVRKKCFATGNTRYKIMISLFSSGIPASSTNKTDSHYKTEILLKVVLNTIAKLLTPTLVVGNRGPIE